MIKQFLKVVPLLVVFLFSCSEDAEEVTYPSAGDYQPLKIGSYYIYDCDSIAYNDFTTPVTIDTFSFQLKEEITDTFTDLSGHLNYRIERYKKFESDTISVDSIPWQVTDIWFVTQNGNNIERVEENIRYVSLMNPVKEGSIWDGNGFNFKESWDFQYQDVEESKLGFGKTITVNQILEDQFIIIYKLYEEVYAENVGLISRTRINVESQDLSNPSIPVINRAEKGFQYFQTINSYFIP